MSKKNNITLENWFPEIVIKNNYSDEILEQLKIAQSVFQHLKQDEEFVKYLQIFYSATIHDKPSEINKYFSEIDPNKLMNFLEKFKSYYVVEKYKKYIKAYSLYIKDFDLFKPEPLFSNQSENITVVNKQEVDNIGKSYVKLLVHNKEENKNKSIWYKFNKWKKYEIQNPKKIDYDPFAESGVVIVPTNIWDTFNFSNHQNYSEELPYVIAELKDNNKVKQIINTNQSLIANYKGYSTDSENIYYYFYLNIKSKLVEKIMYTFTFKRRDVFFNEFKTIYS
ncbi:hypothetical protein [Mycoplasma nasistruthionis]|uniref:Uncharacterized protein n=1 Tax=Mycoplasma nasistruthionis TaxID=353852 RepID=A0A5B7XVH1_9MOLU|nr:hypothetical protein [Mycoplasma nasistruthionis]QCZ36697.1 hypothetical protein FG904_01560 [Mycoplasma nasistruthionis]